MSIDFPNDELEPLLEQLTLAGLGAAEWERLRSLIAEFENSGYFYEVRPRTEATTQTLVIEMKVREAAPPLSAAG